MTENKAKEDLSKDTQDAKAKAEETIEKAKVYFVYEKIIWVDLVLVALHIVYIFVTGNKWSWIPLIGIRLVRIVLHGLSR